MRNVIMGLAIVATGVTATAETTFKVEGKDASKAQTIIALANKPGTKVVRCQDVYLSDQATLKVVPKNGIPKK